MNTKQQKATILMLPWLAHGHISPYFELAKKLSQRNFHIFFCSTLVNLKPLRESYEISKLFSSIQFIDLQLPPLPELPPHFHTTKDLPPHLMSTLKTAFDAAKPAFCNILKTLKPNLVIYDFIQPWAPAAAHQQNIEAVLFLTVGAASSAFFTHNVKGLSIDFPFAEFFFSNSDRQKITEFMQRESNGIKDKDRHLGSIENSSIIILIKTSREIEAKYIDYLSVSVGKEVIPVGPLVPEPAQNDDDTLIMEWLDKKENSSVVFVSFGSEYFLSKEETEEIAFGLELSKVSFIWVLRFHSGSKMTIQAALPEGFLKRNEERGLVLENWAPQKKILGHSGVGGFVTHCGWSSTLEGVMFGVPIIAMAMRLDQPLNAKLVVEIGAGKEVPTEHNRLKRERIAKVVNEVVVQEGQQMRRKAKAFGDKMRKKGDEEMDLVVKKLMQLVRGI